MLLYPEHDCGRKFQAKSQGFLTPLEQGAAISLPRQASVLGKACDVQHRPLCWHMLEMYELVKAAFCAALHAQDNQMLAEEMPQDPIPL